MTAPLALIILDGFGDAPPSPSNAISEADPRFYRSLLDNYPHTTLACSGEEVGLPCGLMGNSEVGHLNIGAGRIVRQEISRIDKSIDDGDFFDNKALVGAAQHAARSGSTLHLMGLVSDGGVHSSDQHLYALLKLAKAQGLAGDRVVLHAFLDGRDTPPRSAIHYVNAVEERMRQIGCGRIGSVIGRYHVMDRDKRWERVKRGFDVMVHGIGERAETATKAIEASYAKDEGDEFVQPTVIGDPAKGRIRGGDAAIFFNFRADRARQISEALTAREFTEFERRYEPDLHMATMTRYRDDLECEVAFAPSYLKGILPEIVSRAGRTQLRIAETEKYAHVTFFMSGGDEKEYPGERRILVPSPKVATYDKMPAMSAELVTDELLAVLDEKAPDLTILNYANADMVGHTGKIDAAVEAVKTLDHCLSRVVPKYLELGGTVAITADHGNCEMMVDPNTSKPHTAHTTNPVPFILIGKDLKGATLKTGGRLCDIATTLLPLMELPIDARMEGVNLL